MDYTMLPVGLLIGSILFMAYMFGTYDESEETPVGDSRVTGESSELRKQAQAVFAGSMCLLPWFAPVAVFGMIASGAIILATWPTAACQEEISTEITQKRFGCAWLWWSLMAAIVLGAAYVGLAGGAVVYMGMRGL